MKSPHIFGGVLFCVAANSFAEPTVYRFDIPTPVQVFALRDFNPSLPSISIGLDIHDPGGGSGYGNNSPAMHEGDEFYNFGTPVLYEIEAADIRGNDPDADIYQTFAEYEIDSQLSPWRVPIPNFDFNLNVMPPIYLWSTDFCTGCSVNSCTLMEDMVHYLPFRWRDLSLAGTGDTGWHYGWVAMRGETTINPDPGCTTTDGCPFEQSTFASVEYIGFGLESEPDMAIIAGGGLCPADLNFDARVDFFDVSTFLDLYTDGDPGADLDNSGTLDFFDVSAFINQYGSGCQS